MKCRKCGFYMDEQLKVCPQCGEIITDAEEGKSDETFGATGEPPVRRGPHKAVIIGIIALVAAICAGLFISYYRRTYICREIHLNKQAIELLVDETDALNAEFVPETTKNKSLKWSSSDENVAKVDGSGIVTAVGSGECVITAESSNGKTDSCNVLVKSLVDIQKESVASVVDYIRKSGPVDENGTAVTRIADIDDEHSFSLGSVGDDLVLIYKDAVDIDSVDVSVNYTTYLNLASGNIEQAEVVQDNQVVISGYPVSTNIKGTMPLAEYQSYDSIKVDSVVSNLEGLELNDSLQKQVDAGTRGCYREFKNFLDSHPALGCTMESFGFAEPVDAPPAPAVTESTVEDVAMPGAESGAEAVESGAESVRETAESMAEIPFESAYSSVAEHAVILPAGLPVDASESGASAEEPEEVSAVSSAVEQVAAPAPAAVTEPASVAAAAESVAETAVSGAETMAPVAEQVISSAAEAAAEAVESLPAAAESVAETVIAPPAAAAASAAESVAETESAPAEIASPAVDEALSETAEAVSTIESAPEVLEEIADESAAESVTAWAPIPVATDDIAAEEESIEAEVESLEEKIQELENKLTRLESLAESSVESLAESSVEAVAEVPNEMADSATDSAEIFRKITESNKDSLSNSLFGARIFI